MKKLLVLMTLSIMICTASMLRAEDANTKSEAPKPNILFAIADDASFPFMGAYGCDWVKTPAFDRIAEEGILFMNTYTPNAKCAPSRSCIVTGRNSWQLENACNHYPNFPTKFKSYAEALDENGYHVGKTGKGWAPGSAVDEQGKNRNLAGKPYEARKTKPPTSGISGNDYAANFADFLDANTDGKPWCFWYGSTEPHRGYEYMSGANKGGKSIDEIDHVPAFWPDNEIIRNDMLDYAYEVEYFDSHLGRMLEELEKRGELENTLVIVTADNGMPFPRIKGQEYEYSNHLPMAAMWPAGIKNPGRKVTDYVSFIDLAPTYVELAGLDWEAIGMSATPGRSLTDIFYSEKSGRVNPERDYVIIGKERHDIGRPNDWGYPIRGIVSDGLLYLHNYETDRWPAGNPETGYLNCDGSPTKTEILEMRRDGRNSDYWKLSFGKRPSEEMYNIVKDPECMQNQASNPEYAAKRGELQDRLETMLKGQGDPRVLGQSELLESYPYSDVRQQDFYGKYMSGQDIKAGWVSPGDFEKQPIEE